MQNPTDEQVRKYIDSVPGLRKEWGIPSAMRSAKIFFVLMNILLIALIAGCIAYFILGDPSTKTKEVSGLIIVIVLVYVASVLRIFQLKAERKELPEYRKALAQGLLGDPGQDTERQIDVNKQFKWESIRYQRFCRMIGLAGFIIITINTYQLGAVDVFRVMLFNISILAYLVGALWANYEFKVNVLEVELEERCRATIRWQKEHPGEAQNEEQEQETSMHDEP